MLSKLTELTYRTLAKPLFFQLDPELVHTHLVKVGKTLGRSDLTRQLIKRAWSYQHSALHRTFDGITFPNPVGLSAGFDYNGELTQILPSVGFGWHTIGTVTLHPYAGNPAPRLGRYPQSQALLVNKGLKNKGAEQLVQDLSALTFAIPVGISIASTNTSFATLNDQITDITTCFEVWEKSRVKHHYYELNISCPNTFGGESFTTPERLVVLLKALDRLKLNRPLYVKMPIDQSWAETLALLNVMKKHQVQGVIFGNLTKDKNNSSVHPADRKHWRTQKGNLSGKPTWQRSNTLLQLTREHFPDRFTLIGTGGIFSGEDAQHKISLGADLVQLITGMIYQGPQLIGQINRFLDTHPKPRWFLKEQ